MSVPALAVANGGLTRNDMRRVYEAFAERRSPNTVRMYDTQWRKWERWALAKGLDAFPAVPSAVAAYLAEIAEVRKPTTVQAAKSAIGAAHRLTGEEDPCKSEAVAAVVQGLKRIAAKQGRSEKRQAKALTDRALDAIRRTACLPRRHPKGGEESIDAAWRRGVVDIAIVQAMRDAGLRRAELAALRWRDVDRMEDGSGRLTVRRSKTDQAGEGKIVAVTALAMADLDAIRVPLPDTRVFRLSEHTINRRVKEAARAAGLGDGYSGHSGRVGMARRMIANGAPMPVVMLQGRWDDPKMPSYYARNEDAGEALKYL